VALSGAIVPFIPGHFLLPGWVGAIGYGTGAAPRQHAAIEFAGDEGD
jgi:hypothetical protein